MKYELPSTELIVIEENNYLKFGEYLNDMQCDDTANKLSLDDLEYVKKLRQENKILKENAEHNDKVVDKVNWENQLLKKQIKTLDKTSIQLISKLDRYDVIVDERDELKKQLEEKENIACNWKDSCLENAGKIEILENQQKEFIKWLEDEIYNIEPNGTGINYNCEYDSEEDYVMAMREQSRLNTLKEILKKYKSIIGVSDENTIK